MNWKIGLDKYLTTEPDYDYDYDSWCELVIELHSNDFYDENEDWILNNDCCNKWLNKLYGKKPEEAVKIIERAFNIYFK